MNKDIRQLEDNLINVLNASDISVEVKRLIVETIMYKLSHEADKIIIAEIQEENNAESTQ